MCTSGMWYVHIQECTMILFMSLYILKYCQYITLYVGVKNEWAKQAFAYNCTVGIIVTHVVLLIHLGS